MSADSGAADANVQRSALELQTALHAARSFVGDRTSPGSSGQPTHPNAQTGDGALRRKLAMLESRYARACVEREDALEEAAKLRVQMDAIQRESVTAECRLASLVQAAVEKERGSAKEALSLLRGKRIAERRSKIVRLFMGTSILVIRKR